MEETHLPRIHEKLGVTIALLRWRPARGILTPEGARMVRASDRHLLETAGPHFGLRRQR
jgi:hypothetical protein